MDFAPSARAEELRAKLVEFDQDVVRPAEPIYRAQREESGEPALPAAGDGGAEDRSEKARPLEPLPPGGRARSGPLERRLRAVVRSHGHVAAARRGDELLGARHRQHGDPGPVRHTAAAGAMASAVVERRNPFVLRDDRAVGRVVGRDEHLEPHRARRRRLRDQRSQVVYEWRTRSALQGRGVHGRDRPRHRHVPPPVDDPRADGRARCHRAPRAARVRTFRRWRARRNVVGERACAKGESPRRGRFGLCHRAGSPRPGAYPPLHAGHRNGRTRARVDVPARADACGVQEAARRPGCGARTYRRVAHADRAGAAPHAEGRVDDGHRRQEERADRDRLDQGARGPLPRPK